MNRTTLLNLALLIIAAALATFIYLSEETSTELDRLTDIDITTLSTVEIVHNGRRTTLHKTPGQQWQITHPVSVDANNFRINSILKLVNAPVHKQYSINELDTERLGLKSPTTTVRMDDTDFHFGIINPATNLRFIQSGDTVYTIEDVYYPLLSSHFGTLISLSLLPHNSNIDRLILINQTISKDDSGSWYSNIDISADSIVTAVDDWKSIQAFGIHEQMQREQLGEVFVYLSGIPQPITFQLTDADPWLIIARPELGIEYHLDIEAYDKIIAPQ